MATPSKCPGRLAPSNAVGQARDPDGGGRPPAGEHLLHRRGEHEGGARLRRQLEVGVEVPGVAGQVLARRELQRVDEDRHRGHVTFRRRPGDQRGVARVEGAHGGHQPDGAARGPLPVELLAQHVAPVDQSRRPRSGGRYPWHLFTHVVVSLTFRPRTGAVRIPPILPAHPAGPTGVGAGTTVSRGDGRGRAAAARVRIRLASRRPKALVGRSTKRWTTAARARAAEKATTKAR